MTKREAKRYVWQLVASSLKNDLDGTGADWIYGDHRDPRDVVKVEAAAREVLDQLERRAGS